MRLDCSLAQGVIYCAPVNLGCSLPRARGHSVRFIADASLPPPYRIGGCVLRESGLIIFRDFDASPMPAARRDMMLHFS